MSLKIAPEFRTRKADLRAGPWSLAARLNFSYVLSTFILLTLAISFLYWALQSNLNREDNETLFNKADVLRVIITQRPHASELMRQEVEWESAARHSTSLYVRVRDARGRNLMESSGMDRMLASAPFPTSSVDRGETLLVDYRAPDGRSYRLLSATATLGGPRGPLRVIQVALDRSDEANLLAEFRRNMAFVLLSTLLLSAALGHWIARRGMRPVQNMIGIVQAIQVTHLHQRVACQDWPRELRALARAFDDMLDRLEDAFARLSRFSADLAHELRTPLNNLRGEAEVALSRSRSADEYRQVIESSLEEYERLSRMIDSLLFLARAESTENNLTCSRFDVREELETIAAYFELSAEEQAVNIVIEGTGTLQADRLLFQQALGNLLANALRYTPRGGEIRLAIHSTNQAVRIRVRDTGSGIAPEHLPHVFDRFYRADPARTRSTAGTGLGLSIVRSIMTLHGGKVSIDSNTGQGTTVFLDFPNPTLATPT